MTYGDGQRISCVGRLGCRREPKKTGHHRGYLRLVGPTITRDGSLDLSGCVARHGDSMTGSYQETHGCRLSRSHGAANVVLAEYSFDRHDIRVEFRHELFNGPFDKQEALRKLEARRGSDHADMQGIEFLARSAGDHGHPATGKTGIYPENAHEASECHPNMCSTL
jgi:hypothetical protein